VNRRPLILSEVEHAVVSAALNAYAQDLRKAAAMDPDEENAEIAAVLEVLEGGPGAGRADGLIGRLGEPPFVVATRIASSWRPRTQPPQQQQPATPAGA
jgi:hypothetical protein